MKSKKPKPRSLNVQLKEARERINQLEKEREHLQKNCLLQHEIISTLRNTVRPFAFELEREQFKGTNDNLTRCYIRDIDVQRARAILYETRQS